MSSGTYEKREIIIQGMKKSKGDFVKRYGKDAEKFMYARANKLANKNTESIAIKRRPSISAIN